MYCKLFASLYQGTLRGRANEILVFTNLLACADRHGNVDKHFRAIAEETGISVDDVKLAIESLESPDPESRSTEHGGARLVRLDNHRAWGWKIVNYLKYRAIKNEDDRRESSAAAQRRFREKSRNHPSSPVITRNHLSASVSPSKPQSAHAEAEAEAEAEATKGMQGEELHQSTPHHPPPGASPLPPAGGVVVGNAEKPSKQKVEASLADLTLPTSLDTPEIRDSIAGWMQLRKARRAANTPRAMLLAIRQLESMGRDKAQRALDQSIMRGWVGLFDPDANNQERTVKHIMVKPDTRFGIY